jgi:hypothetical protein
LAKPAAVEKLDLKDVRVEYHDATDALTPLITGFDEKESMLVSKLADSMSPQFKSRVTDSRLATIILERAARVMAQVPTGRVQALTKADKGKSALMSLAHTRYVIPNANAQFDHLTKLRLWDLYSMVYGVMPMMYDYDIRPTYIGPDSWLVPIRNWKPQPGKLSIQDSDYNFIDTMVSVSWLKNQNPNVWNGAALQKLIDKAKEGGTAKTSMEARERSVVENQREQNIPGGKGPAAQVRLVTKYEAGEHGKWVTFCPEFQDDLDEPLRAIGNPHKNARIPVVLKHCFPLIDSIYGLGDFERGKTLQFAMDSLVNLYLDGVKMSIFPPITLEENQYIANSIKFQPGARWITKKTGAITPIQLNPQGLETFQATYGFMTGALLNQNGTTDTAVTQGSSGDGQYGKTPQALAMQQARESSRDNWDRFMMEKAVENLYEAQINLLAKNQEMPINLHIFDAEIEQIKEAGMDDVLEVFDSGKAAKATITKKNMGGCDYKYIIDASTTMQKDQAAEHETLGEIIIAITKAPQLLQAMALEGKQLNVGELIKRWVISSGAQDWEKIVTDIKQAEQTGMEQGSASAMGGAPQVDPATGQPMPPQPGAMPGQQPQAPAQGGAPGLEQMMQALSGQAAPAAPAPGPAPDETKDPAIAFVLKYWDKLPEEARKQVMAGFKLPTDGPTAPAHDQLIKSADVQLRAEQAATPEIPKDTPPPAGVDPQEDLLPDVPGVQTWEDIINSPDPAVQKLAKALLSGVGR